MLLVSLATPYHQTYKIYSLIPSHLPFISKLNRAGNVRYDPINVHVLCVCVL